MIAKANFSVEHIRDLQRESKRDPILLERTLYAFGLLEALSRVGMPFIFKGGTSLMLLLEHPMRLSTDIDIVVAPDEDIDHFIREAGKIFPFASCEEQIRHGHNDIEKRHFKFQYDSPINQRPFYILLDVVFEENHYARLVEKPIRNELLLLDDGAEDQLVRMPDANCMIGDKLTAFAPHTTGISFGIQKEMEIIKQMYDISTLLEVMDDFSLVRETYLDVVETEIRYRGIDVTAQDCLQDTLDTALCILSRGKIHREDYPLLQDGIRRIIGHIFRENFNGELAIGRAAKVFLLAANLLSGQGTFHGISESTDYAHATLNGTPYKVLNYLKRQDTEAFKTVYEGARLIV